MNKLTDTYLLKNGFFPSARVKGLNRICLECGHGVEMEGVVTMSHKDIEIQFKFKATPKTYANDQYNIRIVGRPSINKPVYSNGALLDVFNLNTLLNAVINNHYWQETIEPPQSDLIALFA